MLSTVITCARCALPSCVPEAGPHGLHGLECHAWHAGLGFTRCAWYWYMVATLVNAALSVPNAYSEALDAYACGMNSYGRMAAAPNFCAAEKASPRNCASVALSCPGACARFRD